jgi:hypothetical protein
MKRNSECLDVVCWAEWSAAIPVHKVKVLNYVPRNEYVLGSGDIALRILNLGRITPGTHWIAGWVGCRLGLDSVARRKISSPCRESNSSRPASSVVTILTELPRPVLKAFQLFPNITAYILLMQKYSLFLEPMTRGKICDSARSDDEISRLMWIPIDNRLPLDPTVS